MSPRDDVLRLTPTPATDVAYPKGSLVVCCQCGMPLYKLQQSLYIGEPAARSSWKYAPVTMKDLQELVDRSDLEPGQRAAIKAMPVEDLRLLCERIQTPKAGDFMDCPKCKASFSYGRVKDDADGAAKFNDRAYSIFLCTIPPPGAARPVRR